MCSTVIFQYTCGCTEHVVLECPFSSSAANSHSHSHACSRRYRRHQQKLFQPTTSSSLALSLRMKISPRLPPPRLASLEDTAETKQTTTTTELDEECHDCWKRNRIRNLKLAKKTDDDTASSVTMRDEEEDVMDSRILRERSVNEVILPPPRRNVDVTSSARSFSESFSEG
ncbi:hypothetical protein HD806DRAFT_37557 [Xylariaceae sp. AK1471]|nr:hypothetical protein HD806DRAFT_37557 [Xylariaceae sp. AK1471]